MRFNFSAKLLILVLSTMARIACGEVTEEMQEKYDEYLAEGISYETPEDYESRKARLDFAEQYLKAKYVGQEKAIDALLMQFKPWFLFREPGIRKLIQLGPPGTGKSAAPFDLVSILGLRHKLTSINLADFNENADSRYESILDKLNSQAYSSFTYKQWKAAVDEMIQKGAYRIGPSVFNMEEFQLLANLDPLTGLEKPNKNAESLWELLGSGGRIFVQNPLLHRINLFLQYSDSYQLLLTKEQATELSARLANVPNLELDFSESIFIFNANVDKLLQAPGEGIEDESLLDNYRERAEMIQADAISDALQRMFSKRIISRLSSNYVKYLPPTAAQLKMFIRGKLKSMGSKYDNTKNVLGLKKIQIDWDESVVELIFKKVMFAGAGFREAEALVPLVAIDPIGKLFENLVNDGLPVGKNAVIRLKATMNSNLNLNLAVTSNGKLKGREYNISVPGLKLEKGTDLSRGEKMLIAIHEGAHATVSLATKLLPAEVVRGTSAKSGAGGYIVPAPDDGFLDSTAQGNLDKLAMYLAGYAAEKLVRGDNTAGVSGDFEMATELATKMAHSWGMSPDGNLVVGPILGDDKRDTKAMEQRIQALKEAGLRRAEQILIRESRYWNALSQHIFATEEAPPPTQLALMAQHWTDKNDVELATSGRGRHGANCSALEMFMSGSLGELKSLGDSLPKISL